MSTRLVILFVIAVIGIIAWWISPPRWRSAIDPPGWLAGILITATMLTLVAIVGGWLPDDGPRGGGGVVARGWAGCWCAGYRIPSCGAAAWWEEIAIASGVPVPGSTSCRENGINACGRVVPSDAAVAVTRGLECSTGPAQGVIAHGSATSSTATCG
jgi:hypothetical protein